MAKRRGYGKGTIYQRKDGRWVGRISLGDGRYKYTYGRTRSDVANQLIKDLHDQQQGTLIVGPRQTLEKYLDRWLEEIARQNVRTSTFLRYQELIRLHVLPSLGKKILSKLSAEDLSKLYNDLGKKLSPRTVGHVHRVIHVALKTAVRWNFISRNPADLVDPPKVPRFEIKPLDIQQTRALLNAAKDDPLEALYVLALTTGMRQGELLALKWQDIDVEHGIIYVNRSIRYIKDQGFMETDPKSANSRRNVALTALGIEALRRHRIKQEEMKLRANGKWNEQNLVFCNSVGKPIGNQNIINRSFIPLLKRAGLPRIRFHDLRHSTATLLLSLRQHPKVVQEMLGHSQIGVTMDIYTHVVPSLHTDAATELNNLLTGVQTGVKNQD